MSSPIDGGQSARSVQERAAADRVEQIVSIALGEGRYPQRHVVQHFHEHAAQAEQHHRPELRIAVRAKHQL